MKVFHTSESLPNDNSRVLISNRRGTTMLADFRNGQFYDTSSPDKHGPYSFRTPKLWTYLPDLWEGIE